MRCDGVKFDKVEGFSNPHGHTVSGCLVCLTLKVKALSLIRNVGSYLPLHKGQTPKKLFFFITDIPGTVNKCASSVIRVEK